MDTRRSGVYLKSSRRVTRSAPLPDDKRDSERGGMGSWSAAAAA